MEKGKERREMHINCLIALQMEFNPSETAQSNAKEIIPLPSPVTPNYTESMTSLHPRSQLAISPGTLVSVWLLWVLSWLCVNEEFVQV
jgi:hypothetical protein